MPVDDSPVIFHNSIATATETITLPMDSSEQWDMIRWAKSRGGTVMADRCGVVWERGGAVSIGGANVVNVTECAGWGLEDMEQEERIALRAVATAPPAGLIVDHAVLLALAVQRDTGAFVQFPILLPSVERGATYMEVPEEVSLTVPLCAIVTRGVPSLANPMADADLHDLRVSPYGVIYQDNTVSYNYGAKSRRVVDSPGGWVVLRDHRMWFYAAAGALFEVNCTVESVRPMDVAPDFTNELKLKNKDDLALERRLSFYVNSQLLDGGDLELGGVEVYSGLAVSGCTPFENRDESKDIDESERTATQWLQLRTILRSNAHAIHDICPAIFLEEGANKQYDVEVQIPQCWVRAVQPPPQPDLET